MMELARKRRHRRRTRPFDIKEHSIIQFRKIITLLLYITLLYIIENLFAFYLELNWICRIKFLNTISDIHVRGGPGNEHEESANELHVVICWFRAVSPRIANGEAVFPRNILVYIPDTAMQNHPVEQEP